jgi:hypothetical protein
MEEIIIALIGSIATIVTTLITSKKHQKHMDKSEAKTAILFMILEDKQQNDDGYLPVNYTNILHEYDIYHAAGGNSYITEKVEEYKKWYKEIETGLDKKQSIS